MSQHRPGPDQPQPREAGQWGARPEWSQAPPSVPPGTPPAKRRPSPVVVLLALAALTAIGVGAYVVVRDGDAGGGRGPRAAVEAFFAAARTRDCPAMFDLVSTASFEQAGATRDAAVRQCQAAIDNPGAGIFASAAELDSAEVTNETDTSATVEVTMSLYGTEVSQPLTLVMEEGDWRIDFVSLFGTGGSLFGTGDPGGIELPDSRVPRG